MKRFIVLIFFASLLFGVKPVPRNNGEKDQKTKTEKVIKSSNKTDKKDTKQKDKDGFIDADANGVNDQRESDLQKIKQLHSKHKNLLKKKNAEVKTSKKKSSNKLKNK
ncbi:MAG: hypothetical protein WBB67_05015 [bacterium]